MSRQEGGSMSRPTAQMHQLRQYIEAIEEGVAMRLAELDARVEANERDLAAIGEHLAAERRSGASAVGATPPSDTGEEGGHDPA